MIYGVIAFGVAVFYVSWLLAKDQKRMERSELAFYIVLIAWCSLLIGMKVFAGHRS